MVSVFPSNCGNMGSSRLVGSVSGGTYLNATALVTDCRSGLWTSSGALELALVVMAAGTFTRRVC